MPGPIVDAGATSETKTGKIPALMDFHSSEERKAINATIKSYDMLEEDTYYRKQ